MKIFFLTTCIITCLLAHSFAQLSTANTSATIVNSIQFSKLEDMKFETTIISSADNKRSHSHLLPHNNLNSTGIIQTMAEFSISDQVNNYVSISITGIPVLFNIPGGKIVLRNLKKDYENQNTPVNGKQSLKITGDLYIDPTVEAGLYCNSSDMVIVINYN